MFASTLSKIQPASKGSKHLRMSWPGNGSIPPMLQTCSLVFKKQKNSAKVRYHFICMGKQKLKGMMVPGICKNVD